MMKNCCVAPFTALSLALVSVVPAKVSQEPEPSTLGRFEGHVAVLSANALIGAGTAALTALLLKRDIGAAFAKGALGGIIQYSGKRVAAADWDAAPALGRVLASTGASMVQQASLGGSLLDSIRVPVGPIRFSVSLRAGLHPRVSTSAFDLALLAQALANDHLELDWNRSFSSLAPVFVTRDRLLRSNGDLVRGITQGHLIVLDGVQPGATESFSHEVIHVVQNDFMEVVWDRAVEDWVRGKLGMQDRLRFVYLNIFAPLIRDLDDAILDRKGLIRRLSEAEAEWFER
jgi:hypothetical protein